VKNYYETQQTITAAFADRACEMNIYYATDFIQDGMTAFFQQYGCDGPTMSRTHGAVWAVARTKIHYDRCPLWNDQVKMTVFPVKISPIAVHLNIQVETLEGESLLRCRQELCAIDMADHSLRRVDNTPFPMDLDVRPPALPTPCRRMKVQLGEEALVYRHTVRTSDTDSNHHMNNVAYVRLLVDAFPSSFWEANQVREFDIQYASEGQEGETLGVYQAAEGTDRVLQVKCGDRTLVKAYLQMEPREETR
jgi:acyl-ACP thioesterase